MDNLTKDSNCNIYQSVNGEIKISKKKKSFGIVPTEIMNNPKISLKTKGLYGLIACYINIPGFKLCKKHLMLCNKDGRESFDAAWKDLQALGYLKQTKKKVSKGFEYSYELTDQAFSFEQTENVKELVTASLDADILSVGKPVSIIESGLEYPLTNNNLLSNHSKELQEFRTNEMILSNQLSYVECKKHLNNTLDTPRLYHIANSFNLNHNTVDELITLLADILSNNKKSYYINGATVPAQTVKQRCSEITFETMIGVLDSLKNVFNSNTNIEKPQSYLTTVLYNSTVNNGIIASLSSKHSDELVITNKEDNSLRSCADSTFESQWSTAVKELI